MDNAKMPKNAEKFVCDLCSFKCHKYSNFISHLKTQKHNKCGDDNKMITNDNAKMPAENMFVCNCGNTYKYMSGLSRHKKHCNIEEKSHTETPTINQITNIITPELVMELIKNNKELQQIIVDQHNTLHNLVKNGVSNTTNSLNNNNNKTFNLQFFLNETCKDAMNIMDFVDSIQLQLSDLEKIGEVGYAQGISNIITTNLKALDIKQRPVHCTDKKRETMYIKDENKWEKEDENNTKLRKAIKRVADKNLPLLPKYREKYPGCQYADSKYSDKYNHMVIEAMGGSGNNDVEKENKIIHNISKCVLIDK